MASRASSMGWGTNLEVVCYDLKNDIIIEVPYGI